MQIKNLKKRCRKKIRLGQISKLTERYGAWRVVHGLIGIGVLIMATLLTGQLVLPLKRGNMETVRADTIGGRATLRVSELSYPHLLPYPELAKVMRGGLFKPSAPLSDNPMADKTIERIQSQLKLQCIMQMNGAPVAYVNITGVGLRKCTAGESVQDLFTVVSIGNNSMEITILGHKVVLNM